MSDLRKFLDARIAEDEEVIRKAEERKALQPMTLAEFLLARIDEDAERARRAAAESDWVNDNMPLYGWYLDDRVLAECDAKRRIVSWWYNDDIPDGLLRDLALPYADHPDYQQEWKP